MKRVTDQFSRRNFLLSTAAVSSHVLSARHAHANGGMSFSKNPFTLGVASGDPDHRGVVLWTRLAPEPLQPDGGMPRQPVEVQWEVASDDAMRSVVAQGTTLATPQLGHSVHVELDQLQPDRWYWYRFRCGDAESPVGRTRTMPTPESLVSKVRFAVTSCQNYEQGYFTAYKQMSQDELDLVVHLGDYIYEYAAGRNGKVRTHHGDEIVSLSDYRIRHAQYRSDADLQHMHAQCPWLVTWDDHEFDNNYANAISEETDVDPEQFHLRRINSYQAYYEMMPLRIQSFPSGNDMRLYRKASFGRLAEFLILDTRQYRSDQPNDDRKGPLNEAAWDPRQSILGREQRNWLFQELLRSTSTWNVLAQQVMMGMVDTNADPSVEGYWMDQWPGYAYERMRVMEFIRDRDVSNPVVLTGDIHSNWANELRVNDLKEDEPVVATEWVATSLSSGGNGRDKSENHDALLAENPCIKFHNRERGYIRCEVTPERWKSDYLVVDDVTRPDGKTFERASFVVESGQPKILPA